MKKNCLLLWSLLISTCLTAQHVLRANDFVLPDSGRVGTIYTEFQLKDKSIKRRETFIANGFQAGDIRLVRKGGNRFFAFTMNALSTQKAELVVAGLGVQSTSKQLRDGSMVFTAIWNQPWMEGTVYKTMITALPDSATKTTIYTAYISAPNNNSWKLMGAYKLTHDAQTFSRFQQTLLGVDPSKTNPWIQTERGRWIAIQKGDFYARQASNERPVIDFAKNADSAAQAQKDIEQIIAAINATRIDTTGSKEGVYYKILKEGNGKRVKLTDTVTVFYKGSLLSDDSIFDQTKDKPATFPLNRLIKGWQVAVPLCKVGGAIRIIIPSAQAYSIRSRSKAIPPNSVLVFDIEVVDVK